MLKLSHSSMNMYSDCPRSYKLRYIDKYISKYKGSALYFGVAVDKALEYMLQNKDNENINVIQKSIDIFNSNWYEQVDNFENKIELRYDAGIKYSKADYDEDLLSLNDLDLVSEYQKSLGLEGVPLKIREYILGEIKEGRAVDEGAIKLSNYMAWLSLKRKGPILIKQYYLDILPKIDEVILTQKEISITNADGDVVRGFLDLVATLHDGSIAILDNKTTSVDYAEDSVVTSEQLALYQILLTQEIPPIHVDKAGYLVVDKRLKKVFSKTCKSCGHIAKSQARTCDNVNNDKRCSGEWDKKLENIICKTQFIVDEIPESMLDSVMDRINYINTGIKNEAFDQNTSNCKKPWGLCDYYSICHANDYSYVTKSEGNK